MKQHAQLQQLLAVYRDLDEAERRRVNQHIQYCPDCRDRLDAYQMMDQALASLVDPQPNNRLRESFYTALANRGRWFKWAPSLLQHIPGLTAPIILAVAIIVLATGLWFTLRSRIEASLSSTVTSREAILPTPSIRLVYNSGYAKDNPIDRELVKRFEEMHPHIEVDLQYLPPSAQQALLAASPPPDVMTGYPPHLAIDESLIMSLSDLQTQAPWDNAFSNGQPGFLGAIEPYPYVWPVLHDWAAIYYNKAIFDQYHLVPPRTWNEFLVVCQTLKQNGIMPIILPNHNRWPAGVWFDYLNMRLNSPQFQYNLMRGQVRYDDPRVKQVFDIWRVLLDKGYVMEQPWIYQEAQVAQLMSEGKVAMTLTFALIVQETIPQADQDRLDFFRFPIVDPKIPVGEEVSVISYFIPANAPEPEAAKEFLAYAASIEAQTYLAETLGPSGILPFHPDAGSNISIRAVKQGWELTQKADYLVARPYKLSGMDPMVRNYWEALNQFLQKPDEIDNILTRLEEERQVAFGPGEIK